MTKYFIFSFFCFFSLSISAQENILLKSDEVVQTTELIIPINEENKPKYQLVYLFSAHTKLEIKESISKSDQICIFSIKSYISQEAFNRGIEKVDVPIKTAFPDYYLDENTKSQENLFASSFNKPGNCEQYKYGFNAIEEKIKDNLLAIFESDFFNKILLNAKSEFKN